MSRVQTLYKDEYKQLIQHLDSNPNQDKRLSDLRFFLSNSRRCLSSHLTQQDMVTHKLWKRFRGKEDKWIRIKNDDEYRYWDLRIKHEKRTLEELFRYLYRINPNDDQLIEMCKHHDYFKEYKLNKEKK